jgi:DNA-binding transcriptional regulator YdaS (Cro superfamily)
MDIQEYLTTEDLSQIALARRLGVSKSTITLLMQGARRPSPSLALRIEQATGGAVTRMELLYPDEPPSQSPQAEEAPAVEQEAA